VTARNACGEHGAALLIVLMLTTLLMGLGAGLALLTTTEARIAAHFAAGLEALHAADAAIERVLPDLRATGNWDDVISGGARSTFVDGDASGVRALGDGSRLELTAAAALETDGPWRLYAHAPIAQLLPAGRIGSPVYVLVWVADVSDLAGDVLVLRARAYGAYGARRGVEAVIARHAAGLRVLSWREV
jgi:hypothetical protein